MKNKDVPTINDFVYNESDKHVDMISDSSKQVDTRNYPIKDTHIVDGVSTLSIGVGSLEPAFFGIIGQESTDLVTHVLTNSSEQLSTTSSSPLNTFQSKAFVIGSQNESVGGNSNIICTSRDSRNSMGNHSRIGTPIGNKYICSQRRDTTSNSLSCTGSIEKFDTHVLGSVTQERNLELLCIEEVGVKIILPEIVKESNSSGQMNLANSVLSESPKFISLGHPTVETADIRNIDFATSTRAKILNWLRRDMERDDRLGYTHDFETMRETTAYRNHIKNSELETRQVFEQETWSPENIQRTLPTGMVTRLDDNQLTQSLDS